MYKGKLYAHISDVSPDTIGLVVSRRKDKRTLSQVMESWGNCRPPRLHPVFAFEIAKPSYGTKPHNPDIYTRADDSLYKVVRALISLDRNDALAVHAAENPVVLKGSSNPTEIHRDVRLARMNMDNHGEYAFQFLGMDGQSYLVPCSSQARELIIEPQRRITTGIHAPTLVSKGGLLEVEGGLDLLVINTFRNSVHPVQPHKVIRLGA